MVYLTLTLVYSDPRAFLGESPRLAFWSVPDGNGITSMCRVQGKHNLRGMR